MQIRWLVVPLILLLAAAKALATVTTVGFDGNAGTYMEYSERGVRVTSPCHIDVVRDFGSTASGTVVPGTWVGSDGSGCYPGGFSNPGFAGIDLTLDGTGRAWAEIWVDMYGKPFSLLGFDLGRVPRTTYR